MLNRATVHHNLKKKLPYRWKSGPLSLYGDKSGERYIEHVCVEFVCDGSFKLAFARLAMHMHNYDMELHSYFTNYLNSILQGVKFHQ